ncbi:MAG: SIS domain-containing protein [Armatimonadetes bacterium]|nr:SIS domain-containing protein [Armatimonadota bacterium]
MSEELALRTLLERHPDLNSCRAEIVSARDLLIGAYEHGNKLLLCGNGGSAADCEHIAAELLKSFERPRPLAEETRKKLRALGAEGEKLAETLQQGLRAVSLCGHPAFSTAFANDVNADMAFAQLVTVLGDPGDVLLAVSTSGKARSVCLAAQAARTLGLKVVGLSGSDGGALAPLCDLCIIVPGHGTAEVQELHVPVYHYLCRAIEEHFFPD